jgi:plasmid maintenance system antidote protein VapI
MPSIESRIGLCPIVPRLVEKKWDQKTLSEKTGVPRSSISEFVRGKRRIERPGLDEIAKVLGIPAEHLVLWQNGFPVPGAEQAQSKQHRRSAR